MAGIYQAWIVDDTVSLYLGYSSNQLADQRISLDASEAILSYLTIKTGLMASVSCTSRVSDEHQRCYLKPFFFSSSSMVHLRASISSPTVFLLLVPHRLLSLLVSLPSHLLSHPHLTGSIIARTSTYDVGLVLLHSSVRIMHSVLRSHDDVMQWRTNLDPSFGLHHNRIHLRHRFVLLPEHMILCVQ
jgi:hypothetical protein